jgi:hypothetical protein
MQENVGLQEPTVTSYTKKVYLIQSGANLLFVGFFKKKFFPDRTPFPHQCFHGLHQEHQMSAHVRLFFQNNRLRNA